MVRKPWFFDVITSGAENKMKKVKKVFYILIWWKKTFGSHLGCWDWMWLAKSVHVFNILKPDWLRPQGATYTTRDSDHLRECIKKAFKIALQNCKVVIYNILFKLNHIGDYFYSIFKLWVMFCFNRKHYNKSPLVWLSDMLFWKDGRGSKDICNVFANKFNWWILCWARPVSLDARHR